MVISAFSILLLFLHGCADVPSVRPGIEVLLADSLRVVRGLRVGLLSNQTGVDRTGRRSADRLAADPDVDLVVLYSTEHGFQGTLDQEELPDEIDPATRLPILNVYAPGGLPAGERFAQIDVLVVDLQDIGSRTFTYASTVVQLLELAASRGIRIVVLDRPNPIGGRLVQGPMRDDSIEHFVAMLPVTLRHGMTLGELALLANQPIGAELVVVPAAGWRRDWWFDQTGLPWVRPSPNMPDLESAAHYPGTVLFEATNLSVGRGTPRPFQQVGAPWLDAGVVAAIVRGGAPRGVRVDTVSFVPHQPTDGKWADDTVRGVRLRVLDRSAYNPVETALAVLWAVAKTHADSLSIRDARLDALAGTTQIRLGLEEGRPLEEVLNRFRQGTEMFRARREAFLLYP